MPPIVTQYALDFDPIKAGAIGYSLPSWQDVHYDKMMYEEHPLLAEVIKLNAKNKALSLLQEYFENFYLNNLCDISRGKNRLEDQISNNWASIEKIFKELFGTPFSPEQVLIIGISALPPQIAHAEAERIDLYYKTNDFIPSLLHELIHIQLAQQLRSSGVFKEKMKNPDELRYYIESKTDQLLASHRSKLAQRARARYTLTDEDWNRGATQRW